MTRKERRRVRKECRRRHRELDLTADPEAKAMIGADNRDWCDVITLDPCREFQAGVEEYGRTCLSWSGKRPPEGAPPREIRDQIRESIIYRGGQGAFLAGEVGFGSWLAALSLNVRLLIALAMGGVFALLMGMAASAIVWRCVRMGAAAQPLKQMHRITRGLLVLGCCWLLAFAAALAVLRSPENKIGGGLFWVAMTLISLLSPLTSAFCGAAAELLSWSKRACSELGAVRLLLRDLELLYVASDRSVRLFLSAAGKGITAALALIFLLCASCQAADRPVYVYVDVSPSARSADVTQVLKNFAQGLSTYEGPDTLDVFVTPFFESAFIATPFAEVRIAGNRPRECPLAATEMVSLSKYYADAHQRQCDEWRAQTRREATVGRSAEIAKLTSAIDRLSELKLPGKCTAVAGILKRAVRERPNGLSLVISDMQNSCGPADTVTNLHAENPTFIIPVGSREHAIEESFDAIQAKYARAMPWVQVVESFRLEVVMNAIAHPEMFASAKR